MSAYNTLSEQTDASPCITANGDNICGSTECTVAANWLPLGTKLWLEGFGVCRVNDRMAKRFQYPHVDVSFDKAHDEALQFGRQTLAYKIQ